MSTNLNKAIAEAKKLIRQKFCRHIFLGKDLKPRDGRGLVTWPCSKCGKIYKEPYGLKMLNHGSITGPWGAK